MSIGLRDVNLYEPLYNDKAAAQATHPPTWPNKELKFCHHKNGYANSMTCSSARQQQTGTQVLSADFAHTDAHTDAAVELLSAHSCAH
jgi:hypothetical protein